MDDGGWVVVERKSGIQKRASNASNRDDLIAKARSLKYTEAHAECIAIWRQIADFEVDLSEAEQFELLQAYSIYLSAKLKQPLAHTLEKPCRDALAFVDDFLLNKNISDRHKLFLFEKRIEFVMDVAMFLEQILVTVYTDSLFKMFVDGFTLMKRLSPVDPIKLSYAYRLAKFYLNTLGMKQMVRDLLHGVLDGYEQHKAEVVNQPSSERWETLRLARLLDDLNRRVTDTVADDVELWTMWE